MAAVPCFNDVVLSPLAQRALEHIRRREMMRAGDRVAVAVSGGADSVALLRLLLEVRSELGVVLSVAHFNHKIRGQASDDDETFVYDLATQHGLEFHRSEADVPAYAREHKQSLEAAARELRYEFFRRLTLSGTSNKVATAHTIDDQAETVLMRIVRGTGITGLAGIHPRIDVPDQDMISPGEIVRPLLNVHRADLEAYLRSLDQPWRDDATNADLHHTRNRIRQLVIPLLEREFNPAIRERLAELADIAREEEDFWTNHLVNIISSSQIVSYVWDESSKWSFYPPAAMTDAAAKQFASAPPTSPPENVTTDLPNVALDCARVLERPLAEQRRIVRRATEHMMIGLKYSDVERVLELVRGDVNGVVELAFGLRAWRVGDKVHIGMQQRRSATPVNGDYQVVLPLVGRTDVNVGNGTITVNSRHGTGLAGAVDWRRLPSPELILRPWRAGDRFWPQHSSGPKKIKELLTDKHITGPERKLWPVIASGDDIVWLRGFGVSHEYVASENATDAIVIAEEPLR